MLPPTATLADCPDEDRLAAFVAGTLGEEDARDVERHVSACAGCYHVLAAYARAWPRAGSGASGERTTATTKRIDDLQRARLLAPGTSVGRYVVLEWIGEGGLGVVYAAYDPELDRKVALKLVHPRLAPAGDDPWQARLLREARAMAKLAHPNVVAVHDAGTWGEQVFLAMEFVDGDTLRRWSSDKPAAAVLAAYLDAGRGLAAAHAAGVVHRDFKPENVLVGIDGRARVSDFGLASLPADVAHASGPRTTGTAGTPAYMAPEQQLGARADERSDQWSFCVALVEALAGAHPAEDAGWRAKVPSRLRAALARGMRDAPEERYSSMDALLVDLGHRPRWRGGLVAMGTAALVVAALLAWQRQRSARAEAPRPCAGAEQKLAGVWDDATRAAVSAAFLASGKPYAEPSLRGTSAALDRYARAWTLARTEACEATRVRGEQSAELMDLRVACLDDRLEDMRALTSDLAHADDVVVTHAPQAAESLPRIAYCADTKALLARVKPPSDPAVAAKVESLRRDLAHVTTLENEGKYEDALAALPPIADGAHAIGFAALEGEALYRKGHLEANFGAPGDAAHDLERAIWAADAAGDDLTRTYAASRLLYLVGYVQAEHDRIPALRGQAEAALARLGRDEDAESEYLVSLASALLSAGQIDEAARAAERSLSLRREVYGKDSIMVGQGLDILAAVHKTQGRLDRAIAEEGDAIALLEKSGGASHPQIAPACNNMAAMLYDSTRFEEAAPYARRAVDIATASYGAKNPFLAVDLTSLAMVLIELGQHAEAESLAARALAIEDETLPAGHPSLLFALTTLGEAIAGGGDARRATPILERAVKMLPLPEDGTEGAEAKLALARALAASGRDAARVRALTAEAVEHYRREATVPRDKRDLAAAEAWLAAH